MNLKLVIASVAFIAAITITWFNSNDRKLHKLKSAYLEVQHPDWSDRFAFDSGVEPSGGSGDHKGIWLIDVRRIEVSADQALRYYKEEASRLKLREFRVYELGQWKGFGAAPDRRILKRPPESEGFIVLSQYVTSDSTL